MMKGQKSINLNEITGIEWDKELIKGVYANLFSLGIFQKEVFLDFATILPDSITNKKAHGVARIILSTDGIKALYKLIDDFIKESEKSK